MFLLYSFKYLCISLGMTRLYYFSHGPKHKNKDRSPIADVEVEVVFFGGGGSEEECACRGRFSQSDECQPSRDILEIIRILGYLWKIPAPYSGADNGCHTLLSDVWTKAGSHSHK